MISVSLRKRGEGESNNTMDLADLIDRNAAFTPGKAAIRYEGRALT